MARLQNHLALAFLCRLILHSVRAVAGYHRFYLSVPFSDRSLARQALRESSFHWVTHRRRSSGPNGDRSGAGVESSLLSAAADGSLRGPDHRRAQGRRVPRLRKSFQFTSSQSSQRRSSADDADLSSPRRTPHGGPGLVPGGNCSVLGGHHDPYRSLSLVAAYD